MVGLTEKLVKILEKNNWRLTGNGVKQITESILMAEQAEQVKEGNADAEDKEKLMREWMMGGETK